MVCSAFAAALFGLVVIAQLGSMEWEGPDLGAGSPIILLAALRQFWDAYGATLLGELGLLLLTAMVFWIVLEALFRGGRKGFRVYLGTSIGRFCLLGGAGTILGLFALRDDTGGTFLIGTVVMTGLWFVVSLLETAIRRDAVALIAADFPKLLAVFGTLMAVEMFVAFVLWGSAIAALSASSPAALAIVAVMVLLWMVFHSYLVAVRFSAIEIMRDVVGE